MNAPTQTAADKITAAQLAIGRILRMGARPTQPGDVEEYDRCRAIVMEATEDIDRDFPR